MPQSTRFSSIRSYRIFAAFASLGVLAPSASANLLLDPSSGVVLLSGADAGIGGDDRTALGSHPIGSDFFGWPQMNPFATISVNGNIYFGQGDDDGDYRVQPLGLEAVDRVAPMWGDFKLGAAGQIIETVAADYYAVTWLGLEGEGGESGALDLQVIFVESATVINGMSFWSGDIVFSYGNLSLYTGMLEVMVGLGNAFGQAAALPGHEAQYGWHQYDYHGVFPVGEDQYVLFRPDGADEYDVSIETMIPEPATYAGLLALAVMGLALRRRSSRKA